MVEAVSESPPPLGAADARASVLDQAGDDVCEKEGTCLRLFCCGAMDIGVENAAVFAPVDAKACALVANEQKSRTCRSNSHEKDSLIAHSSLLVIVVDYESV